MRYISIRKPGDAQMLEVSTTDAPTPGPSELLIQVAFAGVNRPDVFQRQGAYPPPAGASPILGLEVSGEVIGMGSEVQGFKLGDQICGLTNGGGYAEQVAVDASHCLPVPKGLDMAQAAALPETCFTVWSNVFERGLLKKGETFLVHGGASGIGTTAIQMAKAMGARVIATASSQEKCEACTELGADLAVNYSFEDFVAQTNTFTDGFGVDVILDMVGGDYIERNMKAAAIDGRIVSIAFLRGAQVELNFMPVMLKRLTLTGSTLRPQSVAAKADIAQALRDNIWPLIESGKIKPLVAEVFPLADAAAAHQLMESHHLIGKVVLDMGVKA